MNELTISQMREVLGISYPTALDIANREGFQRAGVWFIPTAYVEGRVSEIEKDAQNTRIRFNRVAFTMPESS